VTNRSAGTISGGVSGVDDTGGAATVTNAGTIAGGADAMLLAEGFVDRAVVDPGAVFSGSVNGGNVVGATAVSTLELASYASAGKLSGLGTQFINFGQVTVDAGASWTLTGYNTISTGETLTNSGALTIASGGTLEGSGLVNGPVENDGQIIANGGTLVLNGAVTGTGVAQIDNNATLELKGSFAAGGTVSFAGTGPGTLILDDPADFQGTIANIQSGDTIDLANVTPASAALTFTSSLISPGLYGATLTAYVPGTTGNMSTTQTLTLSCVVAGSLAASSPILQSDGNGGTDVTFEPTGLVQIESTLQDGSTRVGSGVVIGPHSILTAAHNLWASDLGASATSITVTPVASVTLGTTSGQFSGTLNPVQGPVQANSQQFSAPVSVGGQIFVWRHVFQCGGARETGPRVRRNDFCPTFGSVRGCGRRTQQA
jgi:hypothetical protein